MEISRRQQYLIRKGALWTERSSWLTHWREISEFVMPRTGRFITSDRNKGNKRHGKIINECATRANRVLAAGLMAGMTSPARPWFRLATQDNDLMEYGPVKLWLSQSTDVMRNIFARSNTYRSLHSLYEELGGYGTAADIVLDDFEDVIRHYNLTAGEYAISTNHRGEVDTLYREYEMTVAQIVSDFVHQADGSMAWGRVSSSVKNLWDNHRGMDSWVPVLHVVEPRKQRDRTAKDAKNMPFASCYIEVASTQETYLRESGFKRFPALAPRWHVAGGDIYGNSPCMEALGSVKQLQHGEQRKSLAIDYKVKPPLQIPTTLKNMPLSTLPGGAMYVDTTGQGNGIRSMFNVDLDVNAQVADLDRIERRINQTMYVDLFLMLAQDDRSGTTAREIAERHEEKLLMLGPVLERLHDELLKPFIDRTFDRMIEVGIVPPPPQELQGVDLNVEFVSMLAQAQRAVGVQSVDRLIGTVGTMAQFKPDVLDKLDGDQIVDAYADMLGVDPSLIVAGDKVAIIREQRAQQTQAMQQAAVASEAAKTAQALGNTDPENLREVTQQFSGYV